MYRNAVLLSLLYKTCTDELYFCVYNSYKRYTHTHTQTLHLSKGKGHGKNAQQNENKQKWKLKENAHLSMNWGQP